MKMRIVVGVFVILSLLAASLAFAEGDKNRGETGKGETKLVRNN